MDEWQVVSQMANHERWVWRKADFYARFDFISMDRNTREDHKESRKRDRRTLYCGISSQNRFYCIETNYTIYNSMWPQCRMLSPTVSMFYFRYPTLPDTLLYELIRSNVSCEWTMDRFDSYWRTLRFMDDGVLVISDRKSVGSNLFFSLSLFNKTLEISILQTENDVTLWASSVDLERHRLRIKCFIGWSCVRILINGIFLFSSLANNVSEDFHLLFGILWWHHVRHLLLSS